VALNWLGFLLLKGAPSHRGRPLSPGELLAAICGLVFDIRAHLREMYDVEVSPDLISRVTGGVLEELAEWQGRPLDRVYPVIFIDALMIKVRDGVVTNRPVYLAIGIDCDGANQVLGLWVGPTAGESAKFWMSVLSELKSRGAADVCIVCCDGLTGLPEAISVTWPQAVVQLCVVHRSRKESTRWFGSAA